MCCLRFFQEEKNELAFLLGAEFIRSAANTSNQQLSFGRSVAYSVAYTRRLSSGDTAMLLEFRYAAGASHRVESAQLNAITSLATLFVTPSLRAQFVSHTPVSQWLSAGPDLDSMREAAYCKNAIANAEMHRTVATAQFSGEIDVRTQLKLLLPIGVRGELRNFSTLEIPNFCVPFHALRTA